MKTFTATPADISHDWHVVDAAGVPLGRLASVVAQLIRGKHKPTYTPHMDGGDFVVVVNAEKVRLTGKKWQDKKYIHHTQFPGGFREYTAEEAVARHPTRLVEDAVRRMLPRTNLGRALMKKLKIYAGETHPHAAQKPAALNDGRPAAAPALR